MPVLVCVAALAFGAGIAVVAGESNVIVLTQVGCQFVEAENGVNHGYTTTGPEDCMSINAATEKDRLARLHALTLRPGKYIFRVTNKDVPYSIGFWLREKSYDWRYFIDKLTKLSVYHEDVLGPGVTQDFEIELKEGEYLYSGLTNPTPDYRLVVTGDGGSATGVSW